MVRRTASAREAIWICLLAVPLLWGFTSRLATQAAPRPARIRIVLVGDSTVTDAMGWGVGFKRMLTEAADCINASANGRSSKSFIAEGRWAQALALKGDYYLIQFGHNDEPGKGPDRETDPRTTYPANLARYVDDVRAIGATPILVTPLTRRQFEPSGSGHIVSTLTPYVDAMRAVAAARKVAIVDLYARSAALCEQLGQAACARFDLRKDNGDPDTTHLNADGSATFGKMVADEIRKAVPPIASWLRSDPQAAGKPVSDLRPNAVVAADGTAQFRTVQDAIDAAPQTTSARNRWVILIKAGTYRELVYVQREKRFVSMVGEDPSRTVVTYNLYAGMTGPDGKPIGTFRTPTATIDADDFTAENLTFENTAGPVGQALAVRVDGDRVVFRNCRFLGWQDTMLLNRGRHYIEDSYIAGDVDYIFGGATAFFERCHLQCRRNGYITAAATPPEQPHGFVFARGSVTGESPEVRTYLGRPWRDFAQVTFLDTVMSAVVRPAGWHNWDKPAREETARYAEYHSTGPGAVPAGRVQWARQLSAAEASAISVQTVLGGGDRWNPMEVPAHPSLSSAVVMAAPATKWIDQYAR